MLTPVGGTLDEITKEDEGDHTEKINRLNQNVSSELSTAATVHILNSYAREL